MKRWRHAGAIVTRFGTSPMGAASPGAWLPLVGAVHGGALWLLMWLTTTAGGPRAGVIIAGFLVFGLDLWLTRGRRYAGLIRLLECEFGQSSDPVTAYLRIGAFQVAVILKLLSLTALAANGQASWLLVAYSLAGMTAAECGAGQRGAGEPVSGGHPGAWVLGAGLALAGGWLSGLLVTAIAAALVAWLMPLIAVHWLGPGARFGENGSAANEEVVLLAVLGLGAIVSIALA